jgi:hypothetical protein
MQGLFSLTVGTWEVGNPGTPAVVYLILPTYATRFEPKVDLRIPLKLYAHEVRFWLSLGPVCVAGHVRCSDDAVSDSL